MKRALSAIALAVLLSPAAAAPLSPFAAASPSATAAEASGLLLGLSRVDPKGGATASGASAHRTLWIAPLDGRPAVAADGRGLVVPRKDGFWRADVKASGGPGWLTDVLAVGPVSASPPERVLTPPLCARRGLRPVQGLSTLRLLIRFLGTGAVSTDVALWLDCGQIDGGESSFRIETAALDPARPLAIEAALGPSGADALARTIAPLLGRHRGLCAHAGTWGVVRRPGRWVVVARVECRREGAPTTIDEVELHVPLPTALVGHDALVPAWPAVRKAVPRATDAFASPGGDLVVVLTPGEAVAYRPVAGRLGRALLHVPLEAGEAPVMAQWATGRHVARWTRELRQILKPEEKR